jgi:hypothetical protein
VRRFSYDEGCFDDRNGILSQSRFVVKNSEQAQCMEA